MLDDWYAGYWVWRITYTALSVAAVTLPAIVAAGIWNEENRRKALAAAAASIIAVTSFIQAGGRATAHEHAYMCMRLAMASFRSGLMPLSTLATEADRCAQYIDYDYLEPGARPQDSSKTSAQAACDSLQTIYSSLQAACRVPPQTTSEPSPSPPHNP
jgi:hypothetical protein